MKINKMIFPVDTLKEGQKVLEVFPDLERIESWKTFKSPNKEKVFKYIIMLYSKESPLNRARPAIKLEDRKERSAIEAGFKKNSKGEFTESVTNIFYLSDKKVLSMILDYLKFMDDTLWAIKVNIEQNMWENFKILMTPIDMEKDTDTIKAADLKEKLRNQIRSMKSELATVEKELFIDQEVMDDIKQRRKASTIESLLTR